MAYKSSNQSSPFFNEFIDVDNFKVRSKPKNTHKQLIKITSKKLPADFFRPQTRQTLDLHEIQMKKGMRTPCFGEDKSQSHSVSLIPKNKVEVDDLKLRIDTLPTEKTMLVYQTHSKKTNSKDLYPKEEQYSYRIKSKEQIQIPHQSTQRQGLKYEKKPFKNQLRRERNISENRIRLNIKKFFMEEQFQNSTEEKNNMKRKWKNHNKLPPLL